MKTLINTSGTSPRLDFVINETFPSITADGHHQVETRNATEESIKTDLVYMITRALLRNIQRAIYTENHDLAAVKKWLVQVFGTRYDADGFADGHYPDVGLLMHCRDNVRDMAQRLWYVQCYRKVLDDSKAVAQGADGEALEFYPGLLTIVYMVKDPETGGWMKQSLRIIKEIPRDVLQPLHDLFGNPEIEQQAVDFSPADAQPILAHRVREDEPGEDERIPDHVSNDNAPALGLIHGGRPGHEPVARYEQDFRTMDFSLLTPRDKALAAAVLERAAVLNSQDVASRMFRARRAMPHREERRHNGFHGPMGGVFARTRFQEQRG